MSWSGFASLLLAHAGLTGLAFAMDRHRKQILPSWKSLVHTRVAFRLGGWACLSVSLLVSLACFGTGTGLTQWFGIFSLAALILILQVTYLPQSVGGTALLALVLGLAVVALP